MRIATFNANSVRSRLNAIFNWLEHHRPDILALQETKVQDDQFPLDAFRERGLHVVFRGEKSYNGVALISRTPPDFVQFGFEHPPRDETRLAYAIFGKLHLVNTYVPQGRDITHAMYEYKLEWFDRLRRFFERKFKSQDLLVWVGDLNVAAEPLDVHNPDLYERHVCYHANVRAALARCRAFGFRDVVREKHPGERLYSFFDYRTPRAVQRGIGWRLDYIFASEFLAKRCTNAGIDVEPRRRPNSSDHTFVWADFDISV